MESENTVKKSTRAAVLSTIVNALEPLDEETRSRIISSINSLYAYAGPVVTQSAKTRTTDDRTPCSFSSLAELINAARAQSRSDKALVCAYWIQHCQDNPNGFKTSEVSKALSDSGNKITGPGGALEDLRDGAGGFIVQVSDIGKKGRALRIWRVSESGADRVEDMINEAE